eukprot:TRINITY_DN4988_c0_g2_i1.p1 TRINITY_DN4988_c0_g2~~TRINITY_DN4988_c0_g2_i1.p1  ORF type:complete len:210 (+),score=27.55 TRINITY_DN4988_c0_g2_i1:186-815(+)
MAKAGPCFEALFPGPLLLGKRHSDAPLDVALVEAVLERYRLKVTEIRQELEGLSWLTLGGSIFFGAEIDNRRRLKETVLEEALHRQEVLRTALVQMKELELAKKRKVTLLRQLRFKFKVVAAVECVAPCHETSVGKEESTCAVCLEAVDNTCSSRLVRCGHRFHENCIGQWFARGSTTCPSCRDDILDSDDEQDVLRKPCGASTKVVSL